MPSIPVQMALAADMESVRAIAAEEIKQLQSASEVLRGLVIVKLFVLDLLGVTISHLMFHLTQMHFL